MVRSKPKSNLWTLVLLALAGSLAVSLTMRVFSFYTLPHAQKGLVLGYLSVVLGLAFLRFVLPGLAHRTVDRKKVLIALAVALGVTALLLALLPYHPAAIRTRHTLTVTNLSGQDDLALAKIELPGEQSLDFATEFPDVDRMGESLILAPGQNLTYSREMVGGVEVTFSPVEAYSRQVEITWDDQLQEVELPVQDEPYSISLPGWTWGAPSPAYRLLGWVNILADGLSLAGLIFCVVLWRLGRNGSSLSSDRTNMISQGLVPYSIPIAINLGGVLLAGLNQLIYPQSVSLSLLLFLLGVLAVIPFIFRQHPIWVLRVAIGVIGLGIAFNVFVIIHPLNDLHLTISTMQDDSFAALAQKAGDSTYLSMGYYRYFRDAQLHIPKALMEELNLYASRLETMNIGAQVFDDPYEYDLTPDEANLLLARSAWVIWPKEGGGTFYLDPGLDQSVREYFFFKFEDQYFLLTRDFINETGIIDVPLSD